MSESITLKLSDEAYAALRRQAQAVGTSPAEEAAASLEQRFRGPTPARSEEEPAAGRERFERHFGEIDLGRPTGTDNASIDADLARAILSHPGET